MDNIDKIKETLQKIEQMYKATDAMESQAKDALKLISEENRNYQLIMQLLHNLSDSRRELFRQYNEFLLHYEKLINTAPAPPPPKPSPGGAIYNIEDYFKKNEN